MLEDLMDAPKTRRENEVWQACDDLWALNSSNLEALKGDAIRDQLIKLGYKKGSPNEIYKYRQSWKESRGVHEKSLAQTVEVADPISRAVSLVYEQIQTQAGQKITAIEQETGSKIAVLEQHCQELETQHAALEQTHQDLVEEKTGLEISLEALRSDLLEQQQQAKLLEVKQRGLETLLSELKDTYTRQIEKLESELKHQGYLSSEAINQAKLETREERDRRVQVEQQNKRLQARIDQLQTKSDRRQETLIKKEFQKLNTAVKKLQLKPKKTSKKNSLNKVGF